LNTVNLVMCVEMVLPSQLLETVVIILFIQTTFGLYFN